MRRAARPLHHLLTALVVFGLAKAHAAFVGHYDFTDSSRFAWSMAYVALLVLAAYGLGLPDLPRSPRQAFTAAVAASTVAAAAISLVQFTSGSLLLPRYVVLGAAVALVPIDVLMNLVARGGDRRAERRDRVVAVVADDEIDRLRMELDLFPERPASVVAHIPPGEAAAEGRLVEAVVAGRATVVVIDRGAQGDERIVAQAAHVHATGVRVRTLSLFYDEWLGKMPLSELERASLLFDIGELHRAQYGRLKRLLDVVVAFLALPLVALASVLVALGNIAANRGPLFYRQVRIGRDGEPFTILKFRTMRPNGGSSPWTAAGDPRITPFGGVLRRSHLDELPQVLNILRGHVSLIGPRPEQPHYVEELEVKIPFYAIRHLVRPGLTGWAQVKYGYADSQAGALEKLQYDFWYLRHQSWGLDTRILARSIRAVFGSTGGGR